MAAVNLVPTIESTALPSTPATDWAANTHDVLAHTDGSAMQTPDPSMPGAFPEDTSSTGELRVESYLPAEADVQSALTSVGQAAKAYVPRQISGYFGGASALLHG
ncbi:hypothetical protein FB451DRAFT_1042618 [Mycena latifolia]|nr:hypothetical protein FB451DRAFT_1042618 [Mycena latifolia]